MPVTKPATMPSYTSKADVAAALTPAIGLARDIALYFEPPYPGRAYSFAAIRTGGVQIWQNERRDPSVLPNHRLLGLQPVLASQKSDVIAPIEALLAHIPPLQAAGKSVALLAGVDSTAEPWTTLKIDDFPICSSGATDDLIDALHLFIRTHENLDMGETLKPYFVSAEWSLDETTANMRIHADTSRNALLRFAVCRPAIRDQVREGKPITCYPVTPEVDPELEAVLSGQTLRSPAAPKAWVLT